MLNATAHYQKNHIIYEMSLKTIYIYIQKGTPKELQCSKDADP